MQSPQLDRLTLAAFVFSVLLGGFNAIGVRFTVMELPPFWGATLRFAPAALLLFAIAFFMRLPMPKGRGLLGAFLFGALNFGGSFAFIYWGLVKVQGGMAQVILALVPLFTLFFAIAQHQETFSWRALLGALLSVAGIALVFLVQVRAHVPILSLLAVVMGAVCFAEASVIVKAFPKGHPIMTNAIGMATGALLLFLISILWRETLVLPVRTATWAALIYLILFGSCAVFILYLYILKRWTASAISYSFVLLPFVTLIASAWLTHERLSPVLLAGAALVLVGVFLGGISSLKKQPLAQPPAAKMEDLAR